ncbi:hypothetical protein XA68_10603 [Ophiocordyceps unilateralis]|uniref:DUF7924 domain-containing protein n=1 Tax=Ophiocordyceps unilateralis TaxID=268505 RepID=A0A2A9PID2_OPHUN|nr:hypothetical protein XA68_10603 [Ophiocordyceps unilateralis]
MSSAPKDQGEMPQGTQEATHYPQAPERTGSDQTLSSPAKKIPSQQGCATPGEPVKKRPVDALDHDLDFVHKRPRRSPGPSPVEDPSERRARNIRDKFKPINPVEFWVTKGQWPQGYYHPDMERLLARKRPMSQQDSTPTSITPSDQRPRDVKATPYKDPRYEDLLESKGSFMAKSSLGIADESKTFCKTLLEANQSVPKHSLFDDDVFESACSKLRSKNEARVIQDISRLLVPSAESLASFGAKHLDILTESVNEGWNSSFPFTKPRPQPDYSVGFRRQAFSDDQFEKLSLFIGDHLAGEQSYFLATFYMFFPFLTCETKCCAAGLDIADRQNAHSMTLAPSLSLMTIRMCEFMVIIHFDFTVLDGKEKWTTHRFIKNVYEIWMPQHLKRICSAIDSIPSDLDFDKVSSLARTEDGNSASPPAEDGQSDDAGERLPTPVTSFNPTAGAKRQRGETGK